MCFIWKLVKFMLEKKKSGSAEASHPRWQIIRGLKLKKHGKDSRLIELHSLDCCYQSASGKFPVTHQTRDVSQKLENCRALLAMINYQTAECEFDKNFLPNVKCVTCETESWKQWEFLSRWIMRKMWKWNGDASLNHLHVLDMMPLHNTLLHSMNISKGTSTSGEWETN